MIHFFVIVPYVNHRISSSPPWHVCVCVLVVLRFWCFLQWSFCTTTDVFVIYLIFVAARRSPGHLKLDMTHTQIRSLKWFLSGCLSMFPSSSSTRYYPPLADSPRSSFIDFSIRPRLHSFFCWPTLFFLSFPPRHSMTPSPYRHRQCRPSSALDFPAIDCRKTNQPSDGDRHRPIKGQPWWKVRLKRLSPSSNVPSSADLSQEAIILHFFPKSL